MPASSPSIACSERATSSTASPERAAMSHDLGPQVPVFNQGDGRLKQPRIMRGAQPTLRLLAEATPGLYQLGGRYASADAC